MGGSPLVHRAIDNYLALYVRAEWVDLARTILTRFASEMAGTGDPLDLDPMDVDDFIRNLVDEGMDVEQVTLVLADGIDFLVTRRRAASNPLEFAVTRQTNRSAIQPVSLSPQPTSSPIDSGGDPELLRLRRMSLTQTIQYLLAKKESGQGRLDEYGPKTLETYLPKWHSLASWLEKRGVVRLVDIKAENVRAYIDAHKNGRTFDSVSVQTKRHDLYAFRCLWSLIVEAGIISATADPTQFKLRKAPGSNRKERNPLSAVELAHLLHEADQCPNEYQRHELKALLLVEGFGGPRASETVGSCFKDLSLKTGVCRIPKGKGNKERDTVFVQAALDEILWLKNYRKARDSDPIFLSRRPGRRGYQLSDFKDSKAITPNTAWRWLHDFGAKAGVHLYNHRLRHTAGTLAEVYGSPAFRRALGVRETPESVERHSIVLLGHESPQVNRGYNKPSLAEVRKVMETAYADIVSLVEKSKPAALFNCAAA